jgi:hypothetical protein
VVVLSNNEEYLATSFNYERPDLCAKHNKKKDKDHCLEARFIFDKRSTLFNEANTFKLDIKIGTQLLFSETLTPSLVNKIETKANKLSLPLTKDVAFSSMLNLNTPAIKLQNADVELQEYINDILAVCASLAEENEYLRRRIDRKAHKSRS